MVQEQNTDDHLASELGHLLERPCCPQVHLMSIDVTYGNFFTRAGHLKTAVKGQGQLQRCSFISSSCLTHLNTLGTVRKDRPDGDLQAIEDDSEGNSAPWHNITTLAWVGGALPEGKEEEGKSLRPPSLVPGLFPRSLNEARSRTALLNLII